MTDLIAWIASGFLGGWLAFGLSRFFFKLPTHSELHGVQRDLRDAEHLGGVLEARVNNLIDSVNELQKLPDRLKQLEERYDNFDAATTHTLTGLCGRMDRLARPRFGDKVFAMLDGKPVAAVYLYPLEDDGLHRVVAQQPRGKGTHEFTTNEIDLVSRC